MHAITLSTIPVFLPHSILQNSIKGASTKLVNPNSVIIIATVYIHDIVGSEFWLNVLISVRHAASIIINMRGDWFAHICICHTCCP